MPTNALELLLVLMQDSTIIREMNVLLVLIIQDLTQKEKIVFLTVAQIPNISLDLVHVKTV